MIVSIGEFTLKKRALLPEFLKLSKQIHLESQQSKGNIDSELSNVGIQVFYSFTHWETKEDMIDFVHGNTHAIALKETIKLCKTASFLHFETENPIDLTTAKAQLKNSELTRVMTFE
ncbi:MAG: hypothetical protein ACN4EF_06975 [Wenyingzhuangia sp.]|uniref:hypothetical protein n=1 Tax=Wenyingzhuangia sp. TaxID=1964193 RepID=UPI0032198A0C